MPWQSSLPTLSQIVPPRSAHVGHAVSFGPVEHTTWFAPSQSQTSSMQSSPSAPSQAVPGSPSSPHTPPQAFAPSSTLPSQSLSTPSQTSGSQPPPPPPG